jgi:hypothetical protein
MLWPDDAEPATTILAPGAPMSGAQRQVHPF